MKEAKDARYTNGHLFTTISVSGMTVCYACNKSITAKEALICLTCNVTIHNRCKDTFASCTKVKQKQQKAALLKNNTALQSISLRSKRLHWILSQSTDSLNMRNRTVSVESLIDEDVQQR
ncbi:rho guanine nucleotide exchange factor 2-like isoform X3 [Nomascus leucogenys]|uniref:rho guanine nucleotide exchange factor 2-like isoform X3 n=1 Tax=Nomascus leucogenys TaxID=61853 RepID=UPI00122D5A58|nr:rho guanine nucleotide exchange factor 2-like isoform X3 [Nomascus leucogenys]